MRFLDVALSSFSYQMDGQVHGFGTDGRVMYFQPQMLGGLYRENRILVNRGYLHMVFHCIFRHFAWSGTEGKKRADDGITIQERMRDLSCDIAVEHMIDGMSYRSIRFSRSLLRRETYRLLEKEGKTLNAQRVYKILSEWNLNEKDLTNLEQEFRTDDHRYWESKKPDQKPNPMLSRKWGEINDGIETDLETFSQEAGERDGDFLEQIKTENRSRYDYREFLRKFAVFHEELAVDDDSFDYNFYTYGLRLYGNMPLIEPLESKEVKKIEEFVIIIDTSMSCSGELVRKFLEETYRGINRRLLMIVGILFLAVFLVLTLFLKIYFIIGIRPCQGIKGRENDPYNRLCNRMNLFHPPELFTQSSRYQVNKERPGFYESSVR